jgi:hypothetical protein
MTAETVENFCNAFGNGDTTILYDSHCNTGEVNDPDDWKVEPFGGAGSDNR